MSRPTYETEKDREKEQEVVKAIWKARGWKAYSTPTLSCVDLVITLPDGSVRCFGEVRTRNIEYGKYEDVMFSAKKMKTIIELSKLTHLPTYLILNLIDGIFIMNCPDSMNAINVKRSGSTRRNDPMDIEENCHLPWGQFKKLQ
jgi:hypothetical protein